MSAADTLESSGSSASQASLAEYISRPPISQPEAFHEVKTVGNCVEFIRELVQHILPKRIQLIRLDGLYSSRGKGRWNEIE